MPPSRPLQIAAAVASVGAALGAGVALGRGTACGGTSSSLWPEDIITLTFQDLRIHRRLPGRYVGRAGDSSWTLSCDPNGARCQIGPAMITAAEWRVITGMLDAAWSLLSVVPGDPRVHNLRLALKELPLESQYSLMIVHPIQIIRRVSDRLFYGVDHPRGGSDTVAHLPVWERDREHVLPAGFELTRRQWILYTGILEAAWLVGETMDGSIGGGPPEEGKG